MDLIRIHNLYESMLADTSNKGAGRVVFVNLLRHGLGLCDEKGNDYKDRYGNRLLKEAKVHPDQFATDELAIGIMGLETREMLSDGNRGKFGRALLYRSMLESTHPGDQRALLEAVGVGIDVSAFADINAWTAATGGLIERKILEAFRNHDYIGDQLAATEPSKIKEGQKVIGVSRLGDVALERQPGGAHARAQLIERYVTLQGTRENALAVDVFKEAAFFDFTGQLMEHAGAVGDWIGYRKELDIIDAWIGLTTGITGKYRFTYDGVAYALYNSTPTVIGSRGVALRNQISNPLIDWTSLQTAWLEVGRFQDPETGTRVRVSPNRMLVAPALLATARLIAQAGRTERRTAPGATQATAQALNVTETQGTPFGGDFGEPMTSFILEQRMTDPATTSQLVPNPGLGLPQSTVNNYWWIFEAGKPIKYVQNWPMTVTPAPANTYEMIDRGIVATWFSNERGMPAVYSPWHVLECTN